MNRRDEAAPDASSTSAPSSHKELILQTGLLATLTLAVYFPALNGRFVWDDDAWTTGIAGLFQGISGLIFLWLHPTALQQYYPLTGTSFWLDYQLWNFWPVPYHVENVLLHAGAALLLWRLLRMLAVPGAWLAVILFTLHPVMVESVAWITERKNVLSLVFYLGSLLAYGDFAGWGGKTGSLPKTINSDKRDPVFYYNLSFVFFVCALFAKTTSFSLPAVILLIIWWKNGKILWHEDVRPTLRFFGVALALCAVTFWLEKYRLGATGADFDLTLAQRCLVAGKAFWFYLGKLFWPASLCFVYARWQPNPFALVEWLFPMAALALVFLLWLARHRIGRGPLTAILFYAGTLFPVLGFLSAYGMRYSFVWDHWVYLSSISIMVFVAVAVSRAATAIHKPAVIFIFALVVLPALASLTWRQAGMFTDVETIWRTTLARNQACPLAHNNLGTLLYLRGETSDAVAHYRAAIKGSSNYYEALYNLGLTQANVGEWDEAIELYRQAINFYPRFPDALNSLGFALCARGKPDEAIKYFHEAIRLKPDFAGAHYNLALALFHKSETSEASNECQTAMRLTANSRIYISLEEIVTLNNDAWKFATSAEATTRDGSRAVTLAKEACDRTFFQQPIFIGTLAAAYAEAGQFEDAISTAQKACAIAAQQGQTNILKSNQELLKLYQHHQPFHELATGTK